ncbi:MAG: 4a-hydroxytetrahydrobiopterin dehydratase [Nitrosopumilus sp.]|nr:4a-hydroxytetrahydrobiopterin dehydratase [Nitrosopumilus sp.]
MNNKSSDLGNWEEIEGKLCKDFKFNNFIESFSFITKIALESEKMDHHPDILISYNKVNIKLITHDKNQITEKDIDLAKKIDQLNIQKV